MTSNLHPVILDHEEFRRIAAEREKIAELWKANGERVAAAEEKYNTRVAEYNAAADRGEDPGPEPRVPDIIRARQRFVIANRNEKDHLRAAERQALIDNADGFEARLSEVEGDLLAAAEQHVAALDRIATEMEPVITTVRTIRAATQNPTKTIDGRIDAATLVDAVKGGYRMLNSEHRRSYMRKPIVFRDGAQVY